MINKNIIGDTKDIDDNYNPEYLKDLYLFIMVMIIVLVGFLVFSPRFNIEF